MKLLTIGLQAAVVLWGLVMYARCVAADDHRRLRGVEKHR
jgi:hypothetical protein